MYVSSFHSHNVEALPVHNRIDDHKLCVGGLSFHAVTSDSTDLMGLYALSGLENPPLLYYYEYTF